LLESLDLLHDLWIRVVDIGRYEEITRGGDSEGVVYRGSRSLSLSLCS
jgi:hypothetical protein